jgi:hypothetical protein
MSLDEIVSDIADALVGLDTSCERFRNFQPGVGPYGEPQLVKRIAAHLNELDKYHGAALTKRTPDLLISGDWAIEVKIARPYGDNGKEAENWSDDLLHPYPGNESSIGDCYKLAELNCRERKAVVVIGYEHTPAKIDLAPLIAAFEAIASESAGIRLSARVECRREGLVHPVHQCVRVFAWEVIGRVAHSSPVLA